MMQKSDLSSTKLLAVSFGYPPGNYTRAIQVARLLKHLHIPKVLVCGEEKDFSEDPTIEPNAEAFLDECLRVPFSSKVWERFLSRANSRIPILQWDKMPDRYRSWKPAVLKRVADFVKAKRVLPDVLITFGQPMTDHLIGFELNRRYRLPWVAHFSDPWVDNPFNNYNPLTKAVNASLERKVVEAAARLIFVSQETLDLVMSKYPKEWRVKARVVPHAFDPQRYPAYSKNSSKLIIRYLGSFYGHRIPKPLFDALRHIASSHPASLANVRFELISAFDGYSTFKGSGMENLPEGLVVIKPIVSYQESLSLMVSADGLVVIDARADNSVFLPSKLIDYIGAGRPILGITPKGTAAAIINQLGGWVADPANVEATAGALEEFIFSLQHYRDVQSYPWGHQYIRGRYEAANVAKTFEGILRELIG